MINEQGICGISRRTMLGAITVAPLFSRRSVALQETNVLRDREIIWRRVMDEMSFEHARVRLASAGPVFSGTVLVAEEGAPLRIEYSVNCDSAWRTRTVTLTQAYLGEKRQLTLEHDGAGNWCRSGADALDLQGCTDVDLGVSPSTNALPINRLGLAPGQVKTIRAAWVRFPSLDVEVAEQSYECLSKNRYRYHSLASGFEAQVEVDQDGFPINYAGIWLRLAEGATARQLPEASLASGFAGALVAGAPSDDMADVAGDFGWLIGGWVAEVIDYDPDGTVRTGSGEWWFSWVLEGRAMQDVWISPARAARNGTLNAGTASDRYGTSLRHFDRHARLWRIAWTNPVSGAVNALSGTREGNKITLIGEDAGAAIRWTFNDIADEKFVWIGERQETNGTWKKEAEFRLRKISS